MKIAICINHFPIGGVGTSTFILANGMRKAGFKADIIATDGQIGTDYLRAYKNGWPIEAICLNELWLRKRLKITYERLKKYDVVINNNSIETQLLLPALPAHIIRLSVIRSTNEPVITEGNLCSPYLDALVAISPEVERLLKESNVKCRCVLIANSVNITSGCKPKLKRPLELAYFGRLTNIDKNIFILPEIAKACDKMGIDYKLDIAGSGSDQKKLETKIKQYELNEKIRFLGIISPDFVGDFLRSKQIGLFTSNYEGFGLSLVEAMAAGCVPIASDIPSYRWILGEDARHLTVPTNNAKAYADRIRMISSDPEFYKQIQERLQKRQQDNFSPDNTVNGYLRLIDDLVKTHDPKHFSPVSLNHLPLPSYYARRCSRAWWFLQKIKYGVHK